MNSTEAPSSSHLLEPDPSHVGVRADIPKSTTDAAAPRRRFGKYRILARLGEGGMAQVHLALMRGPVGFNKLLVVKSMREGLSDPIYLRSFIHEAKLAAQLNHANVVQTYEVGEHGGQLFIAMEYVEGQSLRAVQRRMMPQRLPLAVQLRILVDVARGLHHAHQLKSFDGKPLDIVHRDVSPQNIMLSYEGTVKLLDFGIAKANGSDELTREGMIKGKVDYMAPEQLTGALVDHRADVFPLGVLLWEAITGMRFSGGAEVAEVTKIHNRVMGAEKRIVDVAPDAPTRLVDICNRAISVDRNNRQASAAIFANELSDYLSDTSRSTDSRKLADILAPVFERDRAKLRVIIDEQVKLAEENDDNVDDVADPVPVFTTADSHSTAPEEKEEIASLKATLLAQQRARDLESRSTSRAAFFAVISIAVLVGVVAAMTLTRRENNAREAEAAATTRAETPGGAHERISVAITATPPTARVTLDGSRVDIPFSARIEPDARIHHIVVSANGFAPEERAVTFDRDLALRIDLREETFEPLAEDEGTQGARRAGARDVRQPIRDTAQTAVAQPQTTTAPRETPTTDVPAMRAPPVIDDVDPYQ